MRTAYSSIAVNTCLVSSPPIESFGCDEKQEGDNGFLYLIGAYSDALAQSGMLVGITRTSGRAYRRGQAPIAPLALIAVVTLAAFEVMSIAILSMIAAAAILIPRCINYDEAWGSIDGSILILIFPCSSSVPDLIIPAQLI